MRTFPLKLSLLISSVHHTVFLFSCFCLGCFNVPSAASSSSSFCHTFDLLLSSKNILWTLGVNCFGFFYKTYSSFIMHFASRLFETFCFRRCAVTKFLFRRMDGWRKKHTNNSNTRVKTWKRQWTNLNVACVLARFACGMCKWNKKVNKTKQPQCMSFWAKNVRPDNEKFSLVFVSVEFSLLFPLSLVKVIVNFIISAYKNGIFVLFHLKSGFLQLTYRSCMNKNGFSESEIRIALCESFSSRPLMLKNVIILK